MRTLWFILLVLAVVLVWNSSSEAACTGSSPTWTSTVDRASVATCVSNAQSGDVINVTAGSASWSPAITLPAKDLDIRGATVVTCNGGSSSTSPVTCTSADNTIISCGVCFNLPFTATHIISGFTMNNSTGSFTYVYGSNVNTSKHFRVHHNKITAGSWQDMELASGSVCNFPQGVVDNNILINISVQPQGSDPGDGIGEGTTGNCSDDFWTQIPPIVGPNAIVYIERNHMQHTSSNINSADSSMGGRYVARFNNVTSGRHTFESHPVQGNNRGSQWSEAYENNQQNMTGFSGTANWRGGTGIIFNNRQDAAYAFGVTLQNDRSEGGVGGPFNDCDGTHPGVDQNTGGQSGWRCRDQPGIGYDTVAWVASPPSTYAQVAMPIYIWGNLTAGSPLNVAVSNEGNNQLHMEVNREFYCDAGNAGCSNGVRIGTIAAQPSTCTTGQAYWSTDQGGNWNTLNGAANDGTLYKCTGTNTWTSYYTPLTYPHPWAAAGGGDTTPPAAPTGVTVTQVQPEAPTNLHFTGGR